MFQSISTAQGVIAFLKVISNSITKGKVKACLRTKHNSHFKWASTGMMDQMAILHAASLFVFYKRHKSGEEWIPVTQHFAGPFNLNFSCVIITNVGNSTNLISPTLKKNVLRLKSKTLPSNSSKHRQISKGKSGARSSMQKRCQSLKCISISKTFNEQHNQEFICTTYWFEWNVFGRILEIRSKVD